MPSTLKLNILKRGLLSISMAVISAGSIASAQTAPPTDSSWSPEREIPMPKFVGPATSEERALAANLRKELVAQLTFWQQRGLPNPPDIRAFVIVTDVREMLVEDVLAGFNPTLLDAKNHALTQYEHLMNSQLVDVASRYFARVFGDGEEGPEAIEKAKKYIADKIFDYYAQFRYTFHVPGMHDALVGRRTVREAILEAQKEDKSKEAVPGFPDQDNAFFGRFRRLDLTEFLPLRTEVPESRATRPAAPGLITKSISRIAGLHPRLSALGASEKMSTLMEVMQTLMTELPNLVNMEKASALLNEPARIEPKIVILPRSEQETLGAKVSTLHDPSVSKHEDGHHINHTINDSIHRLIDEALADYFAMATDGNPKIGQFFASVSADIATSMDADPRPSNKKWQMKRMFARMAEKGVLRDMSKPSSVDSIDRRFILADDYSAGDPLRKFMWSLRAESGLSSDLVDTMTIEVLFELNGLPTLMSKHATFALQLRSMIEKARSGVLKFFAARNIRAWLTRAQADLIEEEVQARLNDAITMVEKESGITLNAGQRAKVVKELAPQLRKTVTEEFLANANEVIGMTAEEIVAQQLRDKETRFKKLNTFMNRIGFGSRPFIQADAVVPEYLRAMFRVAQRNSPEAATAVRKLAEVAMNSHSSVVTLPSGRKELVFSKTLLAKYDPIAAARVKTVMANLVSIRDEINKLKGQDETEANDARLTQLNKDYGAQLDFIQEFERTGALRKLFVAHPMTAAVEAVTSKIAQRYTSRSGLTPGLRCEALFGM